MAATKLREFQNVPAVKYKQAMLDAWLENPQVIYDPNGINEWGGEDLDPDREVFRGMGVGEAEANTGGPLRLQQIQANAQGLKRQFVVLDYKANYGKEHTLVAVFTKEGCYYERFSRFSSPSRRARRNT